MIQTILFEDLNSDEYVSVQINKWIKENPTMKITDIKFATAMAYEPESQFNTSDIVHRNNVALVIYDDGKGGID